MIMVATILHISFVLIKHMRSSNKKHNQKKQDQDLNQILESKLIDLEENNHLRDSELEKQHHYDSYQEYVLSLIGFAVGFGSFWRFPYLIYKNGGGVFLIPYFLAMIVLGIPLLYLQTVLGQMNQRSVPFIYARINRGFKILGGTFIFICFHLAGYYNIILTYSYRFLFSAFHNQLPFADQSAIQNKYFAQQILGKSANINEFGGINFFLFILFIMSLYVCYLVVKKGVKTSGKIITFTALMPYFFFLILAIRGLFLQGAGSGLAYLFSPKWEKLFSSTIWIDAIVQVFFQMTVACSGIVNLSSLKPKKQSFIEGIYIIPISLVVCGMLCAVNIFMYLGHFSVLQGVAIDSLKLSGPQLSFNVFPKALAILPWPNLWVLCFFIAMVFLGIDSEFGYIESIFCYLKDETKFTNIQLFGKQLTQEKSKQWVIYGLLIFCPFLTSYAGIYYMQFFDTFVPAVPFSAGALLELYFFVYLIPFTELQNQAYKATGTTTPYWIKKLLQGKLLLGLLIGNLFFAIINQLLLYKEYTIGFYIAGWGITLYPYILAGIYWLKNRQEHNRLTFSDMKRKNSFL